RSACAPPCLEATQQPACHLQSPPRARSAAKACSRPGLRNLLPCCAPWPLLRSGSRRHVLLDRRFELRRRIGAGGLAEVYAAWDRTTSAEVAVKVLHEHLATDAGVGERFRRELSIARSLEHPGIV